MILSVDSGRNKRCPDCRQDLPLTAFTRGIRRKDGVSFYCRDCRVIRDERSRRKRRGPARTKVRPRDLVVPEGQKWCPDCEVVKAMSEFPRNKRMPDGRMTYCKPCHNERTRASYEKNGGARNYHLRRRYGITVADFDRMFAEQDGLCAICREAPAEQVDHDHATGRVRELVCFNCNGALGQFRDRIDLMLRAAEYLRRNADPSAEPALGEPFGVFVGDLTDPRPADERRPA